MNQESRKFLNKLLDTPSATGYEEPIQRVVKTRMKKYADVIETDLHGNLIVGINTKAERTVMLAGHCDQIGFQVTHITKDGYIYINPLGGIDISVVPGSRVTIHAEKGPVQGVIGKTAIHLEKPEVRGKHRWSFDKVWIDIGAKTDKEVKKLVEVGDSATFALGTMDLMDNNITSVALDDKVGLFVVMEALRLCTRKKLNVALYAVSTVQEEVGLRGAITASYGLDPEVGIAVDVTHAFDNPGKGLEKPPLCDLGGGPAITRGPNTNPIVQKMLVASAKKAKIPYQISPVNMPGGNDASAMQVARAGVASAVVGIPQRYMHTQVEMCNLKDIENSAKLLAHFVQSIGARTNFRPR